MNDASRPWTRAQGATLAVVLLVDLLLLVHFHDAFWWAPDEGSYAHVAERLLDGEVLHRDVQDVHAGTIHFLNAGALALFGRRLVSLRYPLVLATLLQSLLLFLLLRRRGPAAAGAAALAGTAYGCVQYLNPSAHWYCLCLGILAAVLLRAPRAARWRPWALGFLLGTCYGLRQLTAVFLAMGVLAWLLLEAPADDDAASDSRLLGQGLVGVMALGLLAYLFAASDLVGIALIGVWPGVALLWALPRVSLADRRLLPLLGQLAAGAALALLPLVAYHLSHGSLGPWIDDTVLAAFGHSQSTFMADRNYLTLMSQALTVALDGGGPLSFVNGLVWCALVLLPALHGATLVATCLRDEPDARPGPLPWLAAFYALVALHYQIHIYLLFALLAPLVGLLSLAAARRSEPRAALIALTVFLSVQGLWFQAGQPVDRGFAGILAGERLALEPSGLARSGLRVGPRDRPVYQELLARIEAEVPPGETLFAVPSSAELFFLSARRNPFRFYNVALGIPDEATLGRCLVALQREPPRLIVHAPTDKYNTLYSDVLLCAVLPHYQPLGQVGRFHLYRLR